jgi:hypothetical protein
MAKTLSNLEFVLALFVLGTAWFLFMEWVWPRLLAATILMYSAGTMAVFIGTVLVATFGLPAPGYHPFSARLKAESDGGGIQDTPSRIKAVQSDAIG